MVSPIGFGCWAIGGYGWGKVDDGDSGAAIRRALELGVNFFDTADVYGLGHSEEVLAKGLGRQRKEVVISTKVGLKWDSSGNITRDVSPKRIIAALEESLRRLRLDCIPLYLIHYPDGVTPITSTMEALVRCQEAGKIRYIGCSNLPVESIREAHAVQPLAAVQAPYNLLDRGIEHDILPCADDLGIAVLAFGPLAQGFLSGKYEDGAQFSQDDVRSRSPYFQQDAHAVNQEKLSRLLRVAAHYPGVTLAQLAIRWVLDNSSVECAITGVTLPKQIEENVGASGWRLAEEDRRVLNADVSFHVEAGH